MRFVAAFVLFAHGVAHLVGFVVPWRLATLQDMPYKTTILGGRVDVGDAGIKVTGALWLVSAVAFGVAAAGAALHTSWWASFTLVVAIASLALCVVGWPDSKIGVVINMAIIAVLMVGMGAGWALVKG